MAVVVEDDSGSGGPARQTRPYRQCLKYQRSQPLLLEVLLLRTADSAYRHWVAIFAAAAAEDNQVRLTRAAAAYTIVVAAAAVVEAYHYLDDPFRRLEN